MNTFAGIPSEYAQLNTAKAIVIPVPYDGTSTWMKGADKGPQALLEAALYMELYDIETQQETYKHGIYLSKPIPILSNPTLTNNNIYRFTQNLLKEDKLLAFLGGEHSVSIGIIQAFKKKYSDLSVVQFDAHADLRESYEDSEYNHACALHWASKNTDLHQIGIRSMDISEKQCMNPDKVIFSHQLSEDYNWQKLTQKLHEKVYITIDLDALDPSIMPATGTPEPGGMSWQQLIGAIKAISQNKTIVGFDIVELCPSPNHQHANFTAAKLLYKILSFILNK